MASSLLNKKTKRMEGKKSHSWLWDTHLGTKNSKWLAENLDEMDHSVKRMLKLIEEDGDSFAKKAEMYYQKRPELIALVDEFHKTYRLLAERYDHLTGELRRNIPSDLQSQGSGISDELPASWAPPDQRPTRQKSGPRAAGFDFFLGIGPNGSDSHKEGDEESSTLDSESESDDSSVNNYSDVSRNSNGSFRGVQSINSEDLRAKIEGYEEQLMIAKEKIRTSEEEINRLKVELHKYETNPGIDSEIEEKIQETNRGSEPDDSKKIQELEGELKITKEKLCESEKELEKNKSEISSYKTKLDREKREVSKLHDRISRYKANLSDRDQEIRGMRETISNANKMLSEENSNLQTEITKLLKERCYLEDNLKEWDLRCQSLEEELRRTKASKEETKSVLGAKIEDLRLEKDGLQAKVDNFIEEMGFKEDRIDELEKKLKELDAEYTGWKEEEGKRVEEMGARIRELEREVERREEVILEGGEEKREAIRQLCLSIEHYRSGYQELRQAVTRHKRLFPVTAA